MSNKFCKSFNLITALKCLVFDMYVHNKIEQAFLFCELKQMQFEIFFSQ